MYFLALATDYDGTLATDGQVEPATVEALRRLRRSGRRLVMVTGRERLDLARVFPELDLFDLVVAENGALLFDPRSGEETPLTPPPDEGFVAGLRRRGVEPLSVGRAIVATWQPNEIQVLETIQQLGLDLQITFNKGAVMVLPAGVTKASGLLAALGALDLSPHNVAGIGDAENDHAFLRLCGASVAVANALPAVKETADLVTSGARGAGVVELIDRMVEDDLASVAPLRERHAIAFGVAEGAAELCLGPRSCALIAGVSGGGKSTLVTAVLERLAKRGVPYCVVDPEGDYEELEGAIQLGDASHPPLGAEIDDVLATGERSLVISLLALDVADRPRFLAELLPRILDLRARTGRPHWLIVDEAHHMLPSDWAPSEVSLPDQLRACLFVTVHPGGLAPALLARVGTMIAVGGDPAGTIGELASAIDRAPPVDLPEGSLGSEEAVVWEPGGDTAPVRIRKHRPAQRLRRHLRKYSEGELGPDRSFFFRGPDGALNLRAYNLMLFNHLADGVDDATWLHHLSSGDYSSWLRSAIKDDELADEVAAIEQDPDPDPRASRAAIAKAINARYTAPAAR